MSASLPEQSSRVVSMDKAARRQQTADTPAWQSSLRRRGEMIVGDELSVLTAFENDPYLTGMWQFNTFANRIESTGPVGWDPQRTAGAPWTDADTLELQRYMLSARFDVARASGRGVLEACIDRHSRRNPIHPVQDYLKGLQHDGQPRLDFWLINYLGALGPESYLRIVGRFFLLQAVARAMRPGCQADNTPVLEGLQGIGKTETCRILAVRKDWFADNLPELGSKDAAMLLAGKWLVEIAELSAIRKSDIESVKSFLTREVDSFRPPYGRRTIDVPRSCAFIATTNEATYLHDRSGNRRFWPVRCQHVNLEGLRRDIGQLWAEAFAAFTAGERWHLVGDELSLAQSEQSARMFVSELEADVLDYLDAQRKIGLTEVQLREILQQVCDIDTKDVDKAGRYGPQVASILTRNGWRRTGTVGRSPNRRTIYQWTEPT